MESSSNEGIVISCTKIQRNDEDGKFEKKTITSTFVLSHKAGTPIEVLDQDRALSEVGNIFAFLHGPIVVPSNPNNLHLPVLSPREIVEMRCHTPQLLDRAVHAMATGNPEFNKPLVLAPNRQDYQRQFLSAIAASDILLRNVRGNPGTPGYFQLMVGELLAKEPVSQGFRELFSAFSIAPSRKYTLKARAKAVLSQLTNGIRFEARDLVLLFFDNIGFKVLGRHASYDQWVIFNIVVVPEENLRRVGFYQDDAPINQRISRVPEHDWNEIIRNITPNAASELAQSIVAIQDEDFVGLSKCTLENILYVLHFHRELSIDNQDKSIRLPRFARIVSKETRVHMDELMAKGHDISSRVAEYSDIRRRKISMPRSEMHGNISAELGEDGIIACEDDDNDDSIFNRYTVNNTTLQAVHEDLSQTPTIDAILDYMLRANCNQLQKWNTTTHPSTDESPLAETMIGCGCDGQPATAMRRRLAEDAQLGSNRKYPEHMFVSFGGFHTVLKSLNVHGEYFEELLKDIWSSFRDSWDKVKWILFPTDPNQRESDYTWFLEANYAVACHNLRRHLDREISALEVNDFMIQRAEEYPICALALLEIRVGTVLKLMRNSEKLGKRGCVPMFLSAVRLMMPLFAVTHKSDYVYLCQDLLKWYYCASPVNKKIYEELMFTQLTANLKPIFHDTFVEKTVQDIRGYAGKTHSRGQELMMEILATEIPLSAGRTAINQNLRNNNAAAKSGGITCDVLSTKDDCPYYKVYAKISEMNLWTPDEAPIIEGKQKGSKIICNDKVLEVPGGGVLHSQILSGITELGRERVEKYFIEYYVNNYGDVKKSDKIVDLSKIALTNERIKKDLQQQLIIHTSTTEKDFEEKNIVTKAEVVELIKRMCSNEKEKEKRERVNINETMPKSNATKDQIIAYLVKWRKAVFKKNPTLKDNLAKEIRDNFASQGMSTKDSRRELLKDTFFQLSESVRRNERYNTFIH